MTTEKTLNGSELSTADQTVVLSQFVHRFTGNHTPAWTKRPMPNGAHYPVQFSNDQDWLKHTSFVVLRNGMLDHTAFFCTSHPTWPQNPELRGGPNFPPVPRPEFNP